MEKPTCKEIWDGWYEKGFVRVLRESDASWRHGTYEYQVFRRESDNTFWAASFEQSPDGETNGLREGTATITQVEPKTKEIITYVKIKEV